MTKPDISRAMGEIERGLKPEGLCNVNFKSIDDPDHRPFCETAPLMRLLKSERFAKYEVDEADAYFGNFDILRKEKRSIDQLHAKEKLRQVLIEYIAKKRSSAQLSNGGTSFRLNNLQQ